MTANLCIGFFALCCVFDVVAQSDQVGQQEFQVSAFERIHFSGDARLHLVQADPATTGNGDADKVNVSVTGLSRARQRLTFENADGVLYIDAGNGADDLVIQLPVSNLREVISLGRGDVLANGLTLTELALESQGSGNFNLQGLFVNDLIVVGAGQARIQVSGTAEHQFVDLAGVGRYLGKHLASQTSEVRVRGAGQVELWVEELLDVNVFGTARVRYSGTPWVLQQISGAGVVNRFH